MLSAMYPLFPRCIGKGELSTDQLKTVRHQCGKLFESDKQRDLSGLLAGELDTQIEVPLSLPFAKELKHIFEVSCIQWIQEAKRFWNDTSKGFWEDGTYGAEAYEIWLNKQVAGDFNPIHIHGGDFSGVLYAQVPDQVGESDQGGSLGIHGPECMDPTRFQMGMIQYFRPVAGDFYVFPAWQPHSVMPFKGEGERWSIAFNVRVLRR